VRYAGFSITAEELDAQISKHVAASAGVAGWAGFGQVVSAVKNIPELRWANTLEVKNAVERVFNDAFGPKEAAAAKPKAKVSALFYFLLC
jgi:glutaminyl-tRNA synthetase